MNPLEHRCRVLANIATRPESIQYFDQSGLV